VIGPPLLQEVVRRLHQKDPEKRYGDEMSLLADLAELGALGGLNLQSGVVRSPPLTSDPRVPSGTAQPPQPRSARSAERLSFDALRLSLRTCTPKPSRSGSNWKHP
jgi:hypothetical protein